MVGDFAGVDGLDAKVEHFVMLGLAMLGEAIEFAAGALGVGKLGGSKRAAALAVVGSLVGAIGGMFVGLPIPIVGSVSHRFCSAASERVLGRLWRTVGGQRLGWERPSRGRCFLGKTAGNLRQGDLRCHNGGNADLPGMGLGLP